MRFDSLKYYYDGLDYYFGTPEDHHYPKKAQTPRDPAMLAELLQKGEIDVNEAVYEKTILCEAAFIGSIDLVKMILNHPDLDKDQENYLEPNALFFALKNGNLDILKCLLENGIGQLNQVDDNSSRRSLLMVASYLGYENVVDFLLANNVDVFHKSRDEYTALTSAILGGRYDMVKKLLPIWQERDAAMSILPAEHPDRDVTDKNILLALACQGGNLDIVKLFEDADFSAKDEDGCTTLMYAVKGKNLDIVKLVLEKSPELINCVEHDYYSALWCACDSMDDESDIEVIKALLQSKDIAIDSVAFCRALYCKFPEVCNLLMEHPNFNANEYGVKELIESCKSKNYEVFRKLLPHIKIKNINKNTDYGVIFLNACGGTSERIDNGGNIEIVKYLLNNYNIDINKTNTDGETALARACCGHIDVVKLLLKQKNINVRIGPCFANICESCEDSKTGIEIAKLLLAKDPGIDVNKRGGAFECATPLMLACDSLYLSDWERVTQPYYCDSSVFEPPSLEPSKDLELIKFLLSLDNVDINLSRTDFDSTALTYSCSLGLTHIVKMLLARPEIDLDPESFHNKLAFQISRNPEIATLMMNTFGYDINMADALVDDSNVAHGRPLLCYACLAGYKKMVKWLLEIDDIDPNVRDTFQKTPLIRVCEGYNCQESLEIVKLLLIKGKKAKKGKIDVNLQDEDGNTALILAAAFSPAIVNVLLKEENVDVNIKNNEGKTAFMVAEEYGDVVVKQLLQRWGHAR
ncbi:MAG: ankyrin repeat domain-containing protein [Holosporales bacterium]|jgi:serine/threonine-protein phosphatase 6 regulatory ankyrin repeat subunit B|nr:ankyrin repeat domain-containing protein [Holosporales bacterium]